MADSGTRWLTLVQPPAPDTAPEEPVLPPVDTGLADVVTLQRRAGATVTDGDAEAFFQDTLMEYLWARDVAGLAPTTLHRQVQPVVEVCDFYNLPPWMITPRHLDQYFAGAGRRATSTLRGKLQKIDGYYHFLEQRYAGEIARRFGVAVESPVDPFNRPVHRGDFGLRIPPSKRATKEFFALWRSSLPDARKYPVACRDYVMAKLTYISAVRAAELCAVKIGDIHWELGQWGRFIVQGKGARRSGARERQAYLFQEGRDLLWWFLEGAT
ncbi:MULTISPECIES: hypothetical protein [Streptomyces]|uniref:hypothetical protein n=1 Tax=Streptomyces TaxID=1883 RepID=UPI002B1D3796|nr:hypothetical protein [Streptomyces phaeochromogenes]